jgi:hypothetical protein
MASETDLPEVLAAVRKEIEGLKEVSLDAAQRQVNLYAKSWDEAKKELEKAEKSANTTAEALDRLKQKVAQAKETYGEARRALGGLAESMREAKNDAEEFQASIDKVGAVFEKMGQKGNPIASMLGGIAAQMKEGGKAAGGLGAMLLALGNDFTRGVIDPLGSTDKMVGAFGKTASQMNEIWKHTAELTTSANKNVLSFGGSLADAARPARLFSDSIASISTTIGMGKDKVGEWMKAQQDCPGMAEAIGSSVGFAGGQIELYGQQILLANAAGRSQQEVTKLSSDMFRQFGERDVKAVNLNLALFKTLSDETKRPVNDIIDQITRASAPLGIFGRKLNETAGIWKTFADGMKGLPIAEVGKMFETVSGKIATMDLNTQAFVAQMSGMARGASALGGALKMEMDMRMPGGVERNLERTMQAITSMTGGRVITLQQATQTPALEMQFQMQRNMAGQMLGVTGGANQSKLLEVLQGVQEGGIANVDASKNIEQLMATGKSVQEQSVTLLERIAISLGRMPEASEALISLGAGPRRDVERAGKAAGAASAGKLQSTLDMAMLGRSFVNAGQQFVSAVTPSMTRFYTLMTNRLSAMGAGAQSEKQRREWVESRTTAPGAPTDVRTPWKSQRGLRATTLPLAIPKGVSRDPSSALLPLAAPRGAPRDDLSSALLPEFQPQNRRSQLQIPRDEAQASGIGERRRAEPEAKPEAITAEPFEPESFTIKVVCEQCHHKLAEKQEKRDRANRGDNY